MRPSPCPTPLPTPPSSPQRPAAERAQATLEMLGSLPVLLLGLLVCVQATLVALSLVFGQAAADRSARGAPRAEALAAVPGPWRSRTTIRTGATRVRVTIRPPVVLPGAGRLRVAMRSEVPR